MTRDIINVQYPVLEHTDSIANIVIAKHTVVQANGITIKDAFSNKNNSMFIIIENNSSTSRLIVKKGDVYPNSMLGDLEIELAEGVSAVQIQDLSRFEKADGSIDLDFQAGFDGTIYAIAKWAGVRTV